ncbi:MAG: hypothetical protein U0670_19760 [Anaerolineae bacterium]
MPDTKPHISRNINLDQARDLLQRVPRACMTFAGTDGPVAQPVVFEWRAERYLIGIPAAAQVPAEEQEVVLLIDEGVYFFDLRAIYVRGQIHRAQAGADTIHQWFELTPLKIVAWDYGTLHEVNDGPA